MDEKQEQALDSLRQEGLQAFYKGDMQTAESLFRKGLEQAQILHNERWTAQFINDVGNVHYVLGEYGKALDHFLRSLALRERLGNKLDIAASLNSLGNVHYVLGEYGKALDHFLRSLALRERLGNQLDIAASLNNLGNVYYRLGEYDKTLEFHTRSLALREKLGDPLAADVATSLNNLGNIYDNLGQYDKSLDYHTRALALRETLGHPQNIAISLNNLGNVCQSLGQYDKSLDYHARALAHLEKLGNPQQIAMSLNNMGNAYWSMGQYDNARECHVRALALWEKVGTSSDTAASLDNLGIVYGDLGQYDESLDYHARALTLREELGHTREIATSLYNLGNAYNHLGQYVESLEYHTRALALRETLGNPMDIAESRSHLARLYEKQGRLDRAEEAFAQAMSALETIGEQVGDPGQLGALQQTLPHLYARYAHLLVQLKRPDEALSLLERGRAQGLARQAALNGVDFTAYLTSEESRQLRGARSDYTAANRTRLAIRSRTEPDDPDELQAHQQRVHEANDRLEEAERHLALLYDGLLARYPAYRQVQGQQSLTPDQLRQLAQNHPDTLFLQYALVDDDTTLLFALSERDGLRAFTLPISEKGLPPRIQSWRDSLLAPQYLNSPRVPLKEKAVWKKCADAEPHEADALYRLLLGPLEEAGLLEPERCARLVLVADGPLLDIPFAALMDGTEQRLIDRCSLSTVFSFSVLTWSAASRRSAAPLLCLADPNGAHAEQFATRSGWYRLQHAQTEAQQVSALFPGAVALIGAEVREMAVKRAMPRHALLHFATHGDLNERDGLRSGLVLADNLLEAREIAGLRLSAKLAVLSACDSGRGQQRGGDGLVGLAWAFRAAGCPSVVASSWPVDDAATSHLMVAFYQGLKAGLRKDAALRAAMQQVRQEPAHAAPYYWAGFQVFGDTSPLPPSLR